MAKLMWKIDGYDSTTPIYSGEVPGGMTVDEIEVILQRLACQHLNCEEIVGASLRRNFKGHNNLLACHKSDGGRSVMTGGNPHYAARLVDVS